MVITRAVLGFALVLTTSACPAARPYVHGPFLVNHSGATLELSVEWLEVGSRDACDAPLAELAAELPERVAPPYRFAIESTRTARLSAPPGVDGSNVGRCPSRAELHTYDVDAAQGARCVLLRVQGDDLPPYLVRADVYWESEDTETRCAVHVPIYEHPGQGALVITHGDGEHALRAYDHVEARKL